MTDERIAEIERVAGSLERDEYEGDDEVLAIECMRELAALLRAAEGDEPSRAFVSVVSDEDFVCTEYADFHTAHHLIYAAETIKLRAEVEQLKQMREAEAEVSWSYKAENEQLKAQLAEALSANETIVYLVAGRLSELDGHDDPNKLIWTSGVIPEPEGEVWQRYEPEAVKLLKIIDAARAKP